MYGNIIKMIWLDVGHSNAFAVQNSRECKKKQIEVTKSPDYSPQPEW